MSRRTALVLCLLAGLLGSAGAGCAIRRPGQAPTLGADSDKLMNDLYFLPPFPEPLPSSGSLWTDGGPGAAMFRDSRAFRVNDLLTIAVNERSLGTNGAETDLSRVSSADIGAAVAFGLEEASPVTGKFNLNQVLTASADSQFSGEGTTSRSSRLDATITVRVMRVLPNGDLVVAGQKSVTINRERQLLTLVGSVRAVDVGSDNRVASASVGDLNVRMWGHGEVDSTNRRGWFMGIMNRLWPF